MEKSKELSAFVEHFRNNSGLVDVDSLEESHIFHWKRIDLGTMDVRDLDKVSKYIKETFSEPENFSHCLPKVGPYNGRMYLTVSSEEITKHIIEAGKEKPRMGDLEKKVRAFFEKLTVMTGSYFLSDCVEEVEEYPRVSKSVYKSIIKERDSLREACEEAGLDFHAISCDVGVDFLDGAFQHTQT